MQCRATILLLSSSALLGGIVGYFAGQQIESRRSMRDFAAFADASYVDAALRARRDVSQLRLLRAGNSVAAIDALEHDLDGNLGYLGSYHDAVSRAFRRAAVYQALIEVRPYRAEYSFVAPVGTLRNEAIRGLGLTPEAAPNEK